MHVGYTLFLTAYARQHRDLRRLRPVNITLDVLLVSVFVYVMGGLHSDIYHFYYVAIVLAGIRYGMWEGLWVLPPSRSTVGRALSWWSEPIRLCTG